ncbi:MAG: hypothetical protein QOH00_1439, partial [Gaiellales bacterium]|nr:hypothetical protein [Gaiellales bacterium]
MVVGGDRARVTRALVEAAWRLYEVATDGRAWEDEEAMLAAGQDTVSFVSAPNQLVRGVSMWVDLDEDLPPAMAAAFRTVVREELERAGVVEARLEVPQGTDEETEEEALFASAGRRSLRVPGIADVHAAIRLLQEQLGEDVLMLARSAHRDAGLTAFLREHTAPESTSLMYLVLADRDGEGPAPEGVALPTDAATVEAFWRTVRAGADLAGQRVELPVWMVRGEEVLARVGDGSVRVSEAVAPAVIEALRALQDPAAAAVASVARDWHEILAARARVKPIKARLEPVQSDWWDVGWRAWEPIGPAPVGPSPMFDPLEAGKRLLASARPMPGDPLHWRWWRAPFGPAISREEAFAWLGVAIVSQRVSQAVEMLAHWDPGPVDEAEASHVAGSWRLPPAANLRALATIIGPERTIEWLYERLARDPRSYGPEQHYASGVRAGLLPLMSAAQLQTLSDRVRSDCQRVPWTHGRVSPHPSHLLAGPLGLHDVCEHTINHHGNLTGANGEYLLYHGLRSP